MHSAAYAFNPEFLEADLMANDDIMESVRTMVDRSCADKGEAAKAMVEFGEVRHASGIASDNTAMEAAKLTPAWQWWRMFDSPFPEPRRVASRVTAQVVSATARERAWSALGRIHNIDRKNHCSDSS